MILPYQYTIIEVNKLVEFDNRFFKYEDGKYKIEKEGISQIKTVSSNEYKIKFYYDSKNPRVIVKDKDYKNKFLRWFLTHIEMGRFEFYVLE